MELADIKQDIERLIDKYKREGYQQFNIVRELKNIIYATPIKEKDSTKD